MSTPRLRVLIVEDSEDDTELMLRELRRGGHELTYERVDTPEAMRAALKRETWDVIVADHVMPHFDSLDALTISQKSNLDLPFIIVSGVIGEDTAVAAMRAGAHDYIMKGNLARLGPAIERELRDSDVRLARRKAEEEERRLHQELGRRNRQLEQRDEELVRRLLELQQSRRRIMETQEAVRRQLAGTLHGPVQNSLIVASRSLKQAQESMGEGQENSASLIAKAKELIEAVNEGELRSVITQLHPSIVRVALVSAIRALINNTQLPFQAKLKVEDSISELDQPGRRGLDEQVKLVAYRVVEEALTNINKHSKAQNAEITIGISASDQMTVEVQDDGCGFDTHYMAPGLGILTMQDYTGALGGYVEVGSRIDHGTNVKAVIPLHPTERAQPDSPEVPA